ncbi:MAG TPA: hypothetical protein VF472_21970 [Burkholderiaceae bacterium]
MTDTILTKQQLAEWLQCSTKHIERRVKEGLPFIPFGPRAMRFSQESVLRWLMSRESCLVPIAPRSNAKLKLMPPSNAYTEYCRQAQEKRALRAKNAITKGSK